jgi:putative ABC transport system permease protein
MLTDLRHAARALAKTPVFTAAAVLCMALGVGANTAIFSVVDALLLRPLPVRALDRMVVVQQDLLNLGLTDAQLDPPAAADIAARTDLFDASAATQSIRYNLAIDGAEPARIDAARTMGAFFELFGGRPALGRYYRPDASRENVMIVVLGYDLWRDRFGGDSSVIGRTVRLNGNVMEVVGVASPGLRYPRTADAWTPFPVDSTFTKLRGRLWMTVVGRLRPGVSHEQLPAQLALEVRRWSAANEGLREMQLRLHARPLVDFLAGELRQIVLVLMGAVCFVLLIACANVACLQLVRAAGRARELAVRAALGASRTSLTRPLLAESALLAAAGGALGVGFGMLAVRALVLWGPAQYPALHDVRLDATVLAFALGVVVLAALAFGTVPALRASRADPHDALRAAAGRGSSAGRAQHRFLHGAVVTQVAFTFTLVLGAGLLIRSLTGLLATDPGFRPERTLTAQVALPRLLYPAAERRAGFYETVIERLRSTPGVEAVAAVSYLPFSGDDDSSPFQISGRTVPPDAEQPHASYNIVSEDFFRAMGIELLRGRAFVPTDAAGAPLVAVVDEELARRYFPGEDPVGRRITQMGDLTIVGVVRSVKQRELSAPDKATIYYPIRQNTPGSVAFVVRGTLPAGALATAVRSAVAAQDATLPVFGIRTMEERVAESLGARRLAVYVLAGFAGLALVLAATGIYGVLSYTVSQRTRELGIRTALGAQAGDVVSIVMRSGARLTVAGLLIGGVGFVALNGVLTSVLYGVSPNDAFVFVSAAAVLGGAALIACYLPARRAAQVSPVIAMQGE